MNLKKYQAYKELIYNTYNSKRINMYRLIEINQILSKNKYFREEIKNADEKLKKVVNDLAEETKKIKEKIAEISGING